MQLKEITDKNLWDNFVTSFEYNTMFQSWNWGEFQKSLGKSVKRWGFFNKNKLFAVVMLNHVNARRGSYLYLRHFPVMDWNDSSEIEFVFDKITEYSKRNRHNFLRVSPLVKKGSKTEQFITEKGFKSSPMHDTDAENNLVIELSQSEEQILQNMRKNTRYYINRAKRDGVEIIKTKKEELLTHFLKIYRDTVKRQKWSAYSDEYIKKEFRAFLKDDQIELFLARYKGNFISGSLVTFFGDQAIYHHSGSLTKYQKIPASYLIQWAIIKEAKKRGKKYYNLWGISSVRKMKDGYEFTKSDHPWNGLSFFKLGFGGEVRQMMHAKDLPLSWRYWITNLYERVERKSRGY